MSEFISHHCLYGRAPISILHVLMKADHSWCSRGLVTGPGFGAGGFRIRILIFTEEPQCVPRQQRRLLKGCHFTFHRLSSKAFPRKPFRNHRRFMNYLTDNVLTTSPRKASNIRNHSRKIDVGELLMNHLSHRV
ncbi:hypothetical protein AVEN_205716-1 [Araneus ventricosus]|uniref:Uncharacterized protein n=1 Tax=Araneus ventricosus TaxID=182803 RepID=A0A4Y2NYN5_ARAVE|nr:hypothetical protein AVEN_205716-1 [Araneus ventricosus]